MSSFHVTFAQRHELRIRYADGAKDDARPDPLEVQDGVPSTIGLAGEDVLKPEARNSISIYNQFMVTLPRFFRPLFTAVKVGVGSKHIYGPGGFMTAHRDTRKPDLDGLPHIMTLIVIKNVGFSGGELWIDGQQIKPNDCDFTVVLFPINAVHEVRPVLDGQRMSFVFPIYGKFDPFNGLAASLPQEKKPQCLYDRVLDAFDEFCFKNKGDSDARGQMQAILRALGNDDIDREFVLYRYRQGDWVAPEHSCGFNEECSNDHRRDLPAEQIIVRYTHDGKSHAAPLTTPLTIPNGATDISIVSEPKWLVGNGEAPISACFDFIRTEIVRMRTEFLAQPVQNDEIKIDVPELPAGPFIYLTNNMFYADATVDHLFGLDRFFYQLCLRNKRAIRMIVANLSDEMPVPIFRFQRNRLVKIDGTKLPRGQVIADIGAEYDDQGSYDAELIRYHCILLVDG